MKKKFLKALMVIPLCLCLYAPTDAANIRVSRTGTTLTVKDGTKKLFKTPFKQETVYTTTAVNARSGPGTQYPKIRVVPAKTKLTRIGKHKKTYNFDIILYNGKVSFLCADYLSKKNPNKVTNPSSGDSIYSASQFKTMGVINWNGWRWTWYSQRVLPGGGLNIPGRHVDSNGYICDKNNYICLASVDLSKGSIVSTPFGKKGKVYDTGCPCGTLDVYTNF